MWNAIRHGRRRDSLAIEIRVELGLQGGAQPFVDDSSIQGALEPRRESGRRFPKPEVAALRKNGRRLDCALDLCEEIGHHAGRTAIGIPNS